MPFPSKSAANIVFEDIVGSTGDARERIDQPSTNRPRIARRRFEPANESRNERRGEIHFVPRGRKVRKRGARQWAISLAGVNENLMTMQRVVVLCKWHRI
jgi:hypothetical protein